jgi:hypothetical protein
MKRPFADAMTAGIAHSVRFAQHAGRRKVKKSGEGKKQSYGDNTLRYFLHDEIIEALNGIGKKGNGRIADVSPVGG